MVYKLSDGSEGSLDFREKAPNSSLADMYLDEDGNVIPGLSSLGGLAVGVPEQYQPFLTFMKNLDYFLLKICLNPQLN